MMRTICIRLTSEREDEIVKARIMKDDPQAKFHEERNPVTLWVDTLLELRHVQGITGVLDAITSEKSTNPFVILFLTHHPFVSAAAACLAEEAWDAAIAECSRQVARLGVSGAFDGLKSTEQRKVKGSL